MGVAFGSCGAASEGTEGTTLGAGGASTAGAGRGGGSINPGGAASSSGAPHCSQNSARRLSAPLQKRQMAAGGAAGAASRLGAGGGSGAFLSGRIDGAVSVSRTPH